MGRLEFKPKSFGFKFKRNKGLTIATHHVVGYLKRKRKYTALKFYLTYTYKPIK